MNDGAPRRSWAWVGDVALSLLLCAGYAAPAAVAVAGLVGTLASLLSPHAVGVGMTLGALLAFGGWVVAWAKLYQSIRDRGRAKALVAMQVLVLLVLPAWGLGINFALLQGRCSTSSCDPGPEVFRVLGTPGIVGFVTLHLLTALAFAVSRRRPEKLRPEAEMLVHGAMLVGLGVHLALAVQAANLIWGVLLFPIALPVAAPLLTVGLYAHELVTRLRRRGFDALTPTPVNPDAGYRASTAEVPATVDAPMHRPTLLVSLATAPALAGAYAVVMAAVEGRPSGALMVLTETCGHAFSRIPVQHIVVHDCHYLCTVAARGTPALVRPERVGRRNGHPILVNRQLAVANAFEDLLHTRWPRFGRAARATYDRLGLPVSRYITRAWMADAVFVAMKPAEWVFYATLLLLDRGDPEARIDRMYR